MQPTPSTPTDPRSFGLQHDVLLEQIDDTVLVVNLATDEIIELNETAARLLELLAEGRSDREAAQALAAEYATTPAAVASDVAATVQVLLDGGVIAERAA